MYVSIRTPLFILCWPLLRCPQQKRTNNSIVLKKVVRRETCREEEEKKKYSNKCGTYHILRTVDCMHFSYFRALTAVRKVKIESVLVTCPRHSLHSPLRTDGTLARRAEGISRRFTLFTLFTAFALLPSQQQQYFFWGGQANKAVLLL